MSQPSLKFNLWPFHLGKSALVGKKRYTAVALVRKISYITLSNLVYHIFPNASAITETMNIPIQMITKCLLPNETKHLSSRGFVQNQQLPQVIHVKYHFTLIAPYQVHFRCTNNKSYFIINTLISLKVKEHYAIYTK